MRSRFWSVPLVFLLVVSAQARIIRQIEIERKPVFDPGDLPFRTAGFFNSLHKLTVEPVIRRDLLFGEGEVLDTFLVAETARILRARPYINTVEIEVTEAGPDSCDIHVTTRDLWTLELSISASGGGGAYDVAFEIADANFRGHAQEILAGYSLTDRRSAGYFAFAEPALFGSHLRLATSYSAHNEGNSFYGGIQHPFWSVLTTWQYGAFCTNQRDNQLFYKDRRAAFAYPVRAQRAGVDLARGWGRRWQLFAGGAFNWSRQQFGTLVTYSGVTHEELADTVYFQIPDEVRVVPSVGIRVARHSFERTRFLDEFGRTEDFPKTLALLARAGWVSRPLGSSVDRAQLGGQVQAGLHRGPLWTNFEARVVWESDADSSEGSTQVEAAARIYVKPWERHVLALQARHSGWYRANYYGQMFVGALSGVRGLPARFDDGTRRWTGTAEYRFYSPLTVLTIGLGSVVFADAGQVWQRDESPDLSLTHVTWGAGLRLGLGRWANERMFRIDFARGPDGWVTTFGFGMYFNFNLSPAMGF